MHAFITLPNAWVTGYYNAWVTPHNGADRLPAGYPGGNGKAHHHHGCSRCSLQGEERPRRPLRQFVSRSRTSRERHWSQGVDIFLQAAERQDDPTPHVTRHVSG